MKKNINLRMLLLGLTLLMVFTFFGGCTSKDSKQDWAYIEKKKTLIAGITYFAPMNYLENGVLIGFETEFTKAVCDELGIEPVFQEISWNAKEIELNAKNIDCIWNGMTINDDRKANMSISKAYMRNKQVLIVKKERLEELGSSVDGKKIVAEIKSAGEVVALGSEEDKIEADPFFKKATYTSVDKQTKALLEVKSGTADGCVVDYIASVGLVGEGTDYADLVVVQGKEFAKEQYGIAFRKDDAELTKKVDEAVARLIKNGKLQEIARKYNLEEHLILD